MSDRPASYEDAADYAIGLASRIELLSQKLDWLHAALLRLPDVQAAGAFIVHDAVADTQTLDPGTLPPWPEER